MMDKKSSSKREAKNKHVYGGTTRKGSYSEDKNTNPYNLTIGTPEQYQKEDSGTSKSI